MENRSRTITGLAAEFVLSCILIAQEIAVRLAGAVGGGVVKLIGLALKVLVIAWYGMYLFGFVGSFIALFVESGARWWGFFWEFLEMGLKSLLFTFFLIAVFVAGDMAKSRGKAR